MEAHRAAEAIRTHLGQSTLGEAIEVFPIQKQFPT